MKRILSLVVCLCFGCGRQPDNKSSTVTIPSEIVGVGDDEGQILKRLGKPHSEMQDKDPDWKTWFYYGRFKAANSEEITGGIQIFLKGGKIVKVSPILISH